MNKRNIFKHILQEVDGSFRYFVVIGNDVPWLVIGENCIECASEQDADKMIKWYKELSWSDKDQLKYNVLMFTAVLVIITVPFLLVYFLGDCK